MIAIAFDTETHLIDDGMLTPKLVCGSFYGRDHARGLPIPATLRYPGDSIDYLLEMFASDAMIIGANIAYDFGVVLAHTSGTDQFRPLLDAIFKAYDNGRVWDIQICEALFQLAQGHLGFHPVTGHKVRYSLALVCELVLGKTDAKGNDEYRLRYAELDGIPFEQWPDTAKQYPIDDAVNQYDCFEAQARRAQDKAIATNIHDLPSQCRAAWALHLGAIWGFRVDQRAVNAYEMELETERAQLRAKLTQLGFLRANETKDTRNVQRAVALAYAGDLPACEFCQGTGFVDEEQRFGVKGKPLKRNQIKCQFCEGLGLDLAGKRLPFTKGRAISISRDTLMESANDDLETLAAYGESDKAIGTYIPFLRGCGEWPLTLKPNVLLNTGRVSYSDAIQQFPRKGKERECILPRDGFVFYSVDYEGLELATHAQSCLWLLDESKLADVLNAGGKPHDMLAARLYGKTDAQYAALLAAGDKKAKALRQAAKPANFGFPGGMGAAKLALAQRMGGPDTTAPDGTQYRGLRFCILLGHAQRCGEKKRMVRVGERNEDGQAPEVPVCAACIDAANELRNAWFKQWPENVSYFEFINERVGDDRATKFIVQHVTGRIRGGVNFTSAANGYFQGLGADGAKRALYAVVKEQYTDRASVLYGSRNILFAHDELIGELPEARASDGVKRVAQIMVEQMKTVLPDVAIRAEPTLMRRWYKEAKYVCDEKGNVLVWQPEK